MKYDGQLLFSDALAITAAAASTNAKDLGAALQLGVGTELYMVTVVDVAFTDAGSNSTLTVSLNGDTTATLASTPVMQTLHTTPARAAVGDTFGASIQPATTADQFVWAYYTPNNGNLTTGSVTTFITDNAQLWVKRAKGYTVSSANQF